MKTFKLIVLFALFVNSLCAQVKVTGEVTDYSGNKLDNPKILIEAEGIEPLTLPMSGHRYKTKLEIGKVYSITYSRAGYFSKYVTIDTKGIPEGKHIHMYIDMSLIEISTGLDSGLFSRPMGIARFRAESEDMTWDVVYSRQRMKTIEAALKDARKKPKNEVKEVSNESEELYIPMLRNPMQIAEPMNGILQKYSLGKAFPNAEFKGYIYLGMVIADIKLASLDMNSFKVDQIFDNLSSALKSAHIPGVSLKDHKKLLTDNDITETRINSVLGTIYADCLDSAEMKGNYQAKDLMAAGAWLEVMWRALNNYNESPSPEVNKFIGEQRKVIKDMIQRLNQYSKQMTDKELAFVADLENILSLYSKIAIKHEGIQSDQSYMYDIPESTIEDFMKINERIRSGALR